MVGCQRVGAIEAYKIFGVKYAIIWLIVWMLIFSICLFLMPKNIEFQTLHLMKLWQWIFIILASTTLCECGFSKENWMKSDRKNRLKREALDALMSRTSSWGLAKHHGHKGYPIVTPETCGTVGERAQVILVWVKAPGVGDASHPRRLRVTKVRPWVMRSLWRADFRMLKNTSIGGVSYEIWQFEWSALPRQRLNTIVAWEWFPGLPRFEHA